MVERPDYASWLAFSDPVRPERFEQVIELGRQFSGFAIAG
jgi:hypothetical protein